MRRSATHGMAPCRPTIPCLMRRGLFHEVQCDESAAQIAAYFRLKLADHVITFDDEECPFFMDARHRLDELQRFGTGPETVTVWRLSQSP